MTLLRTTLFSCLALLTALIAVPTAHAQSYSGGGSTFIDFGDLGGFNNGASGTTEVFDIGFNAGGGADLLGCAGISLEGFMDAFANFEHVFDNFLDNIKQAFFRRLLVEAFSRLPQIGALFDTVNALGNARFELFNESCDIDSIRADARELIRQRCIDGGGTEESCNPATTNADDFNKNANEVSAELKAFHQRMANISEAISGPICKTSVAEIGSTCGLISFLPQMQLCWNIAGGKKSIDDCAQSRTTSAPITSDRLFSTGYDLSDNIIGGIIGGFNQLGLPQDNLNLQNQLFQRQYRQQQAEAAANGDPIPLPSVVQNSDQIGNTRIALINNDLNVGVAQFAQDSGGINKDIEEFKKFLHCSEEDPTKIVADFMEYLGESGADTPDISELIDQVNASDIIKFDNPTDVERAAIGDAEQAAALIATAVGCVMNHQLHISLDTYVALQRLPAGDRRAFQRSAANRVAYLTTEIVLRFLKQKTLNAHAQLAGGITPAKSLENALNVVNDEPITNEGANTDFTTPEPVLIAVRTIADMFENQIQALRSVRTERDAFAAMSAVIYEKINENRERAQGRRE